MTIAPTTLPQAEAELDRLGQEIRRLRLNNIALRFALFNARHRISFLTKRTSIQMGLAIKGLLPVKRYAERFMDDVSLQDIEKASGL